MTKVQIIGDCHTARVLEHHSPDKSDIDLTMWGKAGTKIFEFSWKDYTDQNIMSSGIEVPREHIHEPIGFSEIKDDGLVMPWIGYIDIRQFLPKYKNADELAKYYVDGIKEHFKNARIKLIEPLPQFTEMLLKYEGISPSYTYEERQQQNSEFLAALEKYRVEAGFEESVRQSEILEACGVSEFTTDMTHSDAPHPVDGLKPEYSKKIYELFVRKAKEALDTDKN